MHIMSLLNYRFKNNQVVDRNMFIQNIDQVQGQALLVMCCVFYMISAGFAAQRSSSLEQVEVMQGEPEQVPGVFSESSVTHSWFEDDITFCAPPSKNQNAGGPGKKKRIRRKKRNRQIQRLAEKYVPDDQFSILKTGAIKGARSMENPWEVETSHYTVKTDISKRATGEVALLMELLYDALLRSPFFPDQTYDLERMSVVVTKNLNEFRSAVPGAVNSDRHGGVFNTSDGTRVYARYFVGEQIKLHNVLWENGTKLFLEKVLNITPQWFYEGFSQFFAFSTLEKSLQIMRLSPGAKPRHHLETLWEHIRWEDRGERYRFLKPFSELIRMEDEYISEEEEAQSWGVIHFLLNWNNGKLVENMRKYIGYLHNKEEIKKDPVQMFLQVFGFHPKKMRRPWEKYIFALGH